MPGRLVVNALIGAAGRCDSSEGKLSKLAANARTCNRRASVERFPDERRHCARRSDRERIEPAGTYRAQPRELALGELPCRGDGALAERRRIKLAFEISPRMAVTDAAHRRQLRAEGIPAPQLAQLVDQARLQHRVE